MILRDTAPRLGMDGRLVGLDYSPALIEIPHAQNAAVEHQTPVKLVHGDARGLPFADREFDVVLTVKTIAHIPDGRSIIPEMVWVLRPGGRPGKSLLE